VTLVSERTRSVIASDVEVARTRRARRRGLLGRRALDERAALVLEPCLAIHTAFMRFPIDVAFVARDGRAVALVHSLQPWRIAFAVKAHAAIELPAGALGRHGIELGDRLSLC
jgi:uncharacterized membrane protein (UPF0127 family)